MGYLLYHAESPLDFISLSLLLVKNNPYCYFDPLMELTYLSITCELSSALSSVALIILNTPDTCQSKHLKCIPNKA